ncbi:MAG TPA: sigma-70 family RNA polymerase sigma factor [Vicinamibacterales bacterium]|nr:sigma-70 family RNA polymerase sigma factor [Vicinamibacterales bacterium]
MSATPSFRSTADRDLVARLLAGEQSAVADLATAYGSRIHQLALRYLKSPEDAEEVTQDVLYKAVEKIADFRGDAALSSWLYRITFNTAMSRLRHLRASRGAEVPAEATGSDGGDGQWVSEIPDWSDMADEAVLRGQLRRRLADAVKSLPAIYRAPVILRDLRGLSTEEASSALQLNDQTLKSRLHRGRLLLRRELSDFADGISLHRALST